MVAKKKIIETVTYEVEWEQEEVDYDVCSRGSYRKDDHTMTEIDDKVLDEIN